MKQDALQTLVTSFNGGERRELFGVSQRSKDPVVLEVFSRLFALGKQLQFVDGESPPLWIPVERESLAELQAMYPEDDEESLKEYLEFDLYEEQKWHALRFFEDEFDCGISLYPQQFSISQYLRTGEIFLPEGCDEQGKASAITILTWLEECLIRDLERLRADPDSYYRWLEASLPRGERFGWFYRKDFWAAAPNEEHVIHSELNDDERQAFIQIAPELVEDKPVEWLTLTEYLRTCAICYEGAGYKTYGKTPKEQYKIHADGRDEGLLEIEPDSPEAMTRWLKERPRGGHPFEIDRGGTWTLISLYIHEHEEGLCLTLSGSASVRAATTIRMALALHRAGVRFSMGSALILRTRVLGEDRVGVFPYYYSRLHDAGELFPDELDVHDSVTPDTLEEHPDLVERVRWLPLPRLEMMPITRSYKLCKK